MQTTVISETVERVAINVYADDGHLAYTLRAEPDSDAACPIEFGEYEPDGAAVDTIALSPTAASALADLMHRGVIGERQLTNHAPNDLTIEAGDALITIADTDGRNAVDVWDDAAEITAVAHALRRTAVAVQNLSQAPVAA